jgi:hypothetical protein
MASVALRELKPEARFEIIDLWNDPGRFRIEGRELGSCGEVRKGAGCGGEDRLGEGRSREARAMGAIDERRSKRRGAVRKIVGARDKKRQATLDSRVITRKSHLCG